MSTDKESLVMSKMSIKEAELKLQEKIKKSQERLKKLRQGRKSEIGALAISYKLDELSNEILSNAFKEIAEKYCGNKTED